MGRIALGLVLVSGLVLTGCGGPSDREIRTALERGWTEQTPQMEAAAGLRPAGGSSDTGLLSGLEQTSKTVTGVAHTFGGIPGKVVEAMVLNGSEIAADFGAPGAKAVNDRIQLALARRWSVAKLEVLAKRASSDETVARVQYDVSADMARGRTLVASGLRQTVRLTRVRGRWTVASVAPLP